MNIDPKILDWLLAGDPVIRWQLMCDLLEKRIAGITFFDMEKPGGDSRWNTLRALRVLRSRPQASSPGL